MPDTSVVACPNCATRNRVPADRLQAGATCGNCHARLFQGEPVALTSANFTASPGNDLPNRGSTNRRNSRRALLSR